MGARGEGEETTENKFSAREVTLVKIEGRGGNPLSLDTFYCSDWAF